MRRFSACLFSGAVLAAATLVLTSTTPAQADTAVVSLELNQQFFYAGDPLNLRISIGNPGAETIPEFT